MYINFTNHYTKSVKYIALGINIFIIAYLLIPSRRNTVYIIRIEQGDEHMEHGTHTSSAGTRHISTYTGSYGCLFCRPEFETTDVRAYARDRALECMTGDPITSAVLACEYGIHEVDVGLALSSAIQSRQPLEAFAPYANHGSTYLKDLPRDDQRKAAIQTLSCLSNPGPCMPQDILILAALSPDAIDDIVADFMQRRSDNPILSAALEGAYEHN